MSTGDPPMKTLGVALLPDPYREVSLKQGGRGVALKNSLALQQLGVPISIGQSPGPGTGATVYLATNNDTAYDNAVITWTVQMFGRQAVYATTVITPLINASQPVLGFTMSGIASDFWLVSITLTGGTTPAATLLSSVIAFGVENIPQTTGNSGIVPPPPYVASGGPGASGACTFVPPAYNTTYLITCIADVTSPGAGNAVGDCYSEVVTSTWKNLAGVVTVVPPILSAPNSSGDASMVAFGTPGNGFGPSATTGSEASIPWVIPATLGAGTVVQVAIYLLPLGSG